MKAEKILSAVENLDHYERWAYMVNLGKKAKKDSALAQSIHQFARSEIHYERMLALFSLYGSYDEALIASFLEEPSSIYASKVAELAARCLEEPVLLSLVNTLPASRRKLLFRSLLEARREKVNDALYEVLGRKEQKELISFTSKEFIARHLSVKTIQEWDIAQISRVSLRCPDLVYSILKTILEQQAELSWVIRSMLNQAWAKFYKVAPKLGILLLEQAATRMSLPHQMLSKYASLYPQRIAALMLSDKKHSSVAFSIQALRALNSSTLSSLVKMNGVALLEHRFKSLLPEQRQALYDAHASAWRDVHGALPLHFVESLPTPIRKKEGAHAFDLSAYAAQPLRRAAYLLAFLFQEARTRSEPFLSQPDGEIRAVAIRGLVLSGRYDRACLTDLLEFCAKRQNEQDPVRMAMITALSELPATRWQAEHLPLIKNVIDAALRSRDCSHATMAACAAWLLRMLKTQAKFVMQELPPLVERMGNLYTRMSLESQMTDDEIRCLAPVLMPTLELWLERNRAESALGLIRCFGRRVRAVPEFGQFMIQLCWDKRRHVASAGLQELFSSHFWKEAAQIVPQLIEKDSSWIQQPHLKAYLHRYRQSLITPFLEPRQYNGLFSSGRTKVLVDFYDGFFRWTASQQNKYAASISSIVTSDRRNAWELYTLVDHLSEMPSIDLSTLVTLASLNTKDQALRDNALSALGRADAGRGISTLLVAMDDERARVAVYALRSAIMQMPSRKALELLSQINSPKITVQKEVIRLIGDVAGDGAYAALTGFLNQDNLHPDVHIALLRAFWEHLEHEEVWQHFHQAAQNGSEALARSTIRIPQEGLTEKGRKNLCLQMSLLLAHPSPLVRKEALERLVEMPLGIYDETLKNQLATQLYSSESVVWLLAAQAIIAMCQAQHSDQLVEVLKSMECARALVAVVKAYQIRTGINAQGLETSAKGLFNYLLEKRWQPSQAVCLIMSVLPASEQFHYLLQVEKAELLHPGIEQMVENHVWNDMLCRSDELELFALQAVLKSSSNFILRRMGLSLLVHMGAFFGWTDNKKEALRSYQEDSELWIRDAAEVIEPPQTPQEELKTK